MCVFIQLDIRAYKLVLLCGWLCGARCVMPSNACRQRQVASCTSRLVEFSTGEKQYSTLLGGVCSTRACRLVCLVATQSQPGFNFSLRTEVVSVVTA